MTTQGDLHTITSTKKTGGNDKEGALFKILGVLIITVAVVIVIGGCFSLIYVVYKLAMKNRETYHQFDEEKRASSASNNGESPILNLASGQ